MFKKYNRTDPSPDIDYIVKEIIINSIIQGHAARVQAEADAVVTRRLHLYNPLASHARRSNPGAREYTGRHQATVTVHHPGRGWL